MYSFSRPVRNIGCEGTEWVGSFEQGFLDIAVKAEEINPRVHTHMEITPMNILSVNAALTPFSDFNQSPRNMYQVREISVFFFFKKSLNSDHSDFSA